jgi:hypothetical protein
LAPEDGEQLSGDGNERQLFRLSGGDQASVEGPEDGVVPGGDPGLP